MRLDFVSRTRLVQYLGGEKLGGNHYIEIIMVYIFTGY